MYHRVIARLDIKGPNLVKGIHLEGLRVLGSPEQFANYYFQNGADELMYNDVVASLYDRNSLHEIITRTAKSNFLPLTVGGGIRSLEDIKKILRAGADKVSINTAAIKDKTLISKATKKFGSSTIVVAIEAIKGNDGNYYAYTNNGRESTGIEVFSWAKEIERLGAGEIVITSVDREGTGEGFDLELTKQVSCIVNIPVIAHGGAGNINHVEEVFFKAKADAVAIASILHYDTINRFTEGEKQNMEGNLEFIKNKKRFGNIYPTEISVLKKHLINSKIQCRFN